MQLHEVEVERDELQGKIEEYDAYVQVFAINVTSCGAACYIAPPASMSNAHATQYHPYYLVLRVCATTKSRCVPTWTQWKQSEQGAHPALPLIGCHIACMLLPCTCNSCHWPGSSLCCPFGCISLLYFEW